MDEAVVFLRRPLGAAHPAPHPAWPDGFALFGLAEGEAAEAHALLLSTIGPTPTLLADPADWWGKTVADPEFSPDLCLVVRTASREMAGFALCWHGGFIEHLAIRPDLQGHGLGEHLLRAALLLLEEKGAGFARLRLPVSQREADFAATLERLGFTDE